MESQPVNRYQDLDIELQAEVITNKVALQLAISMLADYTGVSTEVLCKKITDMANDKVSCMSDEKIKAEMVEIDSAREEIRKDAMCDSTDVI